MRTILLMSALGLVLGCNVNVKRPNGHDGGVNGNGGNGGNNGNGGTGPGAPPTMPEDLTPPCKSTDPNKDLDNDGFTPNQGDCDDCNPEVNPNAVEIPGDMVDNDCNGKIDEPIPGCDKDATGKIEPEAIAKSVELCDPRFFKGASMNGPSDPKARNVLNNFGILKPRMGTNFTLLSTGVAVDVNGMGYVNPQEGTQFKNDFDNPLPNLMGASDCGQSSTGEKAKDYTEVAFKLKAPSNAHSLNFDFQFFSGEYPAYVCSPYNDMFFAIVQSSKMYPMPTNVSFDQSMHPITVNSGFFTVCTNSPLKPQTMHCMHPPTDNKDTGYDVMGKMMSIPGGSTGWLQTKVPVMPNEEITLRFVIFDEKDYELDSAVLIDNVAWGAMPVDPGTGPIGFGRE